MEEDNKVIVTGGTGVIGAWAVREFALNGYRPYIFTRGSTKVGLPILKDVEDQVCWVEGDIENPWSIVAAIQSVKPKAIVHLATLKPWQIDRKFVPNPKPVAGVQNMIVGTTNVLEAARRFGIARVVFASTKGVYDAFAPVHRHPDYKPVTEDHPCVPDTMYGLGKLTGERLGDYYKQVFGIDFIALRFATTFGPFKRGSANHPAGLISAALTGQAIDLKMDVKTLTEGKDDFVYNRDVARGIFLAATARNNSQLVYNIGTGTGTTFQQLIDTLNEIVPGHNIRLTITEHPSAFGERTHSGIFDITAAKRDLGYEPQFQLQDAIQDMSTFIKQE